MSSLVHGFVASSPLASFEPGLGCLRCTPHLLWPGDVALAQRRGGGGGTGFETASLEVPQRKIEELGSAF